MLSGYLPAPLPCLLLSQVSEAWELDWLLDQGYEPGKNILVRRYANISFSILWCKKFSPASYPYSRGSYAEISFSILWCKKFSPVRTSILEGAMQTSFSQFCDVKSSLLPPSPTLEGAMQTSSLSLLWRKKLSPASYSYSRGSYADILPSPLYVVCFYNLPNIISLEIFPVWPNRTNMFFIYTIPVCAYKHFIVLFYDKKPVL